MFLLFIFIFLGVVALIALIVGLIYLVIGFSQNNSKYKKAGFGSIGLAIFTFIFIFIIYIYSLGILLRNA